MKSVTRLFFTFVLMLSVACGAPETEEGLELPVSNDIAQAQPTAVPATAMPATDVPAATIPPSATAEPLPTAEPTELIPPTATTVPTLTPTTGPPTETPTPFPTPEPTWTPTVTPINTPRPFPTEISATLAEGTHCVIGVEPDDLLNIREEPSASAAIIGTIPPYGQQVELRGETRSVGTSNWTQIDYFGRVGWVNTTFLARQVGSADAVVAGTALQALNAIRDGDMPRLATLVHPEKGVAFVPTTFISAENPTFSSNDVAKLWDDQSTYLWGIDQATGEDIRLDFRAFYDRYLYSADFLFADAVGYNTNIQTGGIIDNSADIFPGSQMVEYHFDGFDPDFAGLDFRTLRIVLEELEGQQYVVAIVNNEWAP